MITTTFDPYENILHIVRTGKVYRNDLMELLQEVVNKLADHKNLYIVDDLRESDSMFTTTDYPLFAEQLKIVVKQFKQVRHALLVRDAKNTALSMFFQEDTSPHIDNYFSKTFSTSEAACGWLKK